MCGAILPFPQHIFKEWCLIKQEIHLHGVVLSEVVERLYHWSFTTAYLMVNIQFFNVTLSKSTKFYI